jgi:ketosteroid isomerase-like protein
VAKVAETRPAPEPAPKAGADGNAVASTISTWASAWERKDMKAYFDAYAADFQTPKDMSRKDWEAERTRNIVGKDGKISVQIRELQTTVNGDSATAKFRQFYKAPHLNNSTTKTLTLVRVGGRWLIKKENAS